jgi:antitoxin (DNA-binding transcriptional repressor) of toxin-antitoxin stability system
MKTVTWTETTPWEEVLRAGEQEEVVLIRDGHAVALLVPFDDDDLTWYARERDPAFIASIAHARQQVEQGRTMSHQDLERELGLKP